VTAEFVTLPGTARAAGVARHWVALVLEAAGCLGVDEVLLVTSELVGNAVRHTRSGGPGGVILMVVKQEGAAVRIEVVDEGSETVPCPRVPDGLTLSGRGLWLVEELSETWGVRAAGGRRRTVWAVMPMSYRRDGRMAREGAWA